MKYRISTLFIILCATLTTWAQMADPVHIQSSEKVDQKTGTLEVIFQGKIDAGWHVYSSTMKDGGPTVASLTTEKCEGLKPVGRLQTKGNVKTHQDDMFGMEVQTVEGSVTFVQKYRITGEKYAVSGYLTYGACNDRNCIPPSSVDFNFEGKGIVTSGSPKGEDTKQDVAADENQETEASADGSDSVPAASALLSSTGTSAVSSDLWTPVVDQLKSFEQSGEDQGSASLWWIFLMGIGGGLIALLTPCVWPIIPMTVSFFLKRGAGIRDAVTYGISIVVIYVGLGLLVTMLFGASALNAMSTNAIFNIFFFLMLLVFGLSFLGGFELTLPSSWSNAVDSKAEKTTGLLSIFLMAFTLSLVSFSCTGPIIGFLLVEVGTSGTLLAPTVGMLGFALALALPFSIFAMFPAWLKKAPRSGNWMNAVKVTLGFLELAFSLKFLSVADLAYGWHILDREVFLCLWIVIFGAMGAYLLHWIRLPHDEDEYDEEGNVVQNPKTGITRLAAGLAALAFALYMIPGLWGAPCKAVSAFAPPMNTQDFNLYTKEVKAKFVDYDQGMAYARENGLPVMLDFTGYGCVNCRKMEAAVWTDPRVADIINNKYVLITLHVDEKTPLAEPQTVDDNGQKCTLRTVGDRWSYLQRHKFGANAQPFYVLLSADGEPLAPSYSYNEDVEAFLKWLER